MIEKIPYGEFRLRFALERHSDFSSFYQVFVENSYPHLLNQMGKGDVVIDAGANIGVFTVMASFLVGDTGTVISVEPDPENIAGLRKNIKLNNLKNVIIVDRALFQESDMTLNLRSNGTMSSILSENGYNIEHNYNRYSVKTVTFDDMISGRGINPSILKMDIEGAEKFALKGAAKTLRSIRCMEAEIHDFECEQALMTYKEFKFEDSSAEVKGNVAKFALKHPFKTFRLEYNNRFRTAKRVMFKRKNTINLYPKIFYGVK